MEQLEARLEGFTELGEIAQLVNELASWAEVKKEYDALDAAISQYELTILLSGEYVQVGLLRDHPLRRGRHGSLRLGGHAAAHVYPVLRALRLEDGAMIDYRLR